MKTMAPPSVQRGCNSYFADHKKKNIPKNRQPRQNATQAIFTSGRSVGLNLGLKQGRKKCQWAPSVGSVNKLKEGCSRHLKIFNFKMYM